VLLARRDPGVESGANFLTGSDRYLVAGAPARHRMIAAQSPYGI
jgi:hypothetical protein